MVDALTGVDPNINREAFHLGNETESVNGKQQYCENNITDYTNSNTRPNTDTSNVNIKNIDPVQGLRLPRSEAAWKEAHAYFLAYPPLPAVLINIDD